MRGDLIVVGGIRLKVRESYAMVNAASVRCAISPEGSMRFWAAFFGIPHFIGGVDVGSPGYVRRGRRYLRNYRAICNRQRGLDKEKHGHGVPAEQRKVGFPSFDRRPFPDRSGANTG